MGRSYKDEIARLQRDIAERQSVLDYVISSGNDPDASVYPISARNGAMFPDARCLLVWDGRAYAANGNGVVRMTDEDVTTFDELPPGVQSLLLQGIDELNALNE